MGNGLISAALACLQVLEQELLYFAAFWFVLGAFDEFAVDCVWFACRIRRWWRPDEQLSLSASHRLTAPLAVIVAAWQESHVIGHMVSHALQVWPQSNLRFYVGCYGNDAATVAAVAPCGCWRSAPAHRHP